MHLRLHPLLKNHLALLQDFGMNMRPQIASLGVYRLILFFNPDGESRLHVLLSLLLAKYHYLLLNIISRYKLLLLAGSRSVLVANRSEFLVIPSGARNLLSAGSTPAAATW